MSTPRSPLVPSTKTEHESLPLAAQLVFHDHPGRFALLLPSPGVQYGVAWGSELREPVVAAELDGVFWIGVDRRLAAVNLSSGRLVLLLPLDSPLVEVKLHETAVLALTETQLLVFNRDGTFKAVRGLPALPQSLTLEGALARVRLCDGQTLDLKLR